VNFLHSGIACFSENIHKLDSICKMNIQNMFHAMWSLAKFCNFSRLFFLSVGNLYIFVQIYVCNSRSIGMQAHFTKVFLRHS